MQYVYGADLVTVYDVTVPYSTVHICNNARLHTVWYCTVRYVEYKGYIHTAPSGCVNVQHRLGITRSTTYDKK